MSVLSLPVAMAAAVTAYVGLYHIWLHSRRPNRSDLYFALTCFCMLGYDTAAAFHYSSTLPSQAAVLQRVEIASALLMGVPFLLLINEQMRIQLPKSAKLALGFFPALAIITLVERNDWVVTKTPLPKQIVTPFGEWTLVEVALGPLFLVAALAVPLMTLYCLWAAAGAPRLSGGRWERREQRSSPLVAVGIALLAAVMHDLLVGQGLLTHPYLFEFAWLPVTATMSGLLSQEVLDAEKTQAELTKTEQREATTLAAIQDAVVATDMEGNILLLNPAAERLLAVTLSAVVGKPLRAYAELTSPETRTVVKDLVRFAVGRPTNPYGPLPQLVTTDGNERRVDVGGAPLKDPDGHVQGAIVVLRDLTLQHDALATLEYAKKMESLGQLAGGAAHDLNNLLTPILSYVELVQKEVAHDSKASRFLLHVQEAAQRAAGLTRQLLALSRKQVLDVQIVPLAEFVRQTRPILERLIGEGFSLNLRLDDAAGRVRIDLGQFEQVLLNLTSNARDALPDGGQITIVVRRLGEEQCCLEVSDHGVGMSAATVARIFEPFFTTKARGKGTGLGLASVRGIVEQHGGAVYVDSELGEGTSFEIVLPTTTAEQVHSSIRHVPNADAARGTETILVAEDDPGVRSLIHDVLAQLGYTVHTADGLAMAVAIAQAEPLDLLLTDVVLPGADGPHIRDAVNQIHPVPCLFMTGHADERLGHHGIVERGVDVLRKPFTVTALSLKVRQVLDTGKPRMRSRA